MTESIIKLTRMIIFVLAILIIIPMVFSGSELDNCIADTGDVELCTIWYTEMTDTSYCDSLNDPFLQETCYRSYYEFSDADNDQVIDNIETAPLPTTQTKKILIMMESGMLAIMRCVLRI